MVVTVALGEAGKIGVERGGADARRDVRPVGLDGDEDE